MVSPTEEAERELGARLRQLRLTRGWSQRELCRLANVSEGAVRHLESGSGANLTTLVRVVTALGEQQWLDALQPPPPVFSPLAVWAGREQPGVRRTRSRVSRHRTVTASA